ncbi:MAG TPA: tetratricopeptide repeat protein [Trueperaceae bacterium]
MKHRTRVIQLALLLGILLGLAGALAQSTPPPLDERTPDASSLNPAAQESLAKGRKLAQQALDTYPEQYPDKPLWQQAIQLGREAKRQAPGRPEPLRFLGEVYTITHWYGPAWEAWMDYLDAGGELGRNVRKAIALVGNELGFINYQQGQTDEALRYYQRVIDLAPDNVQAYKWVGRILLETGRPAQAIPYWRTVAERQPNDEGAQYFLELAQDEARWGQAAVEAFREGVDYYDQGRLTRARERFARATSLNPDYSEAWAWLGRVAFEQQDYQDAETYYGHATRLEPDNETYSYFYQEAQRRQNPETQRSQPQAGITGGATGGAQAPGPQDQNSQE